MAAVLERISTITSKGQITLPKDVRSALGVKHGGRIAWRVEAESVSVHRADSANHNDPVVDAFLSFLASDMEKHPESISALSPAVVERIAGLIDGVTVDPSEDIKGEVNL